MNIEFPETLEEITVWALEYAHDNTRSYYSSVRRDLPNKVHFLEWLTRIAQLEGAVTHKLMPPCVEGCEYRVSVAGIFVCVLPEIDLTAMYNGELNEH
jgi:hypothetical protein